MPRKTGIKPWSSYKAARRPAQIECESSNQSKRLSDLDARQPPLSSSAIQTAAPQPAAHTTAASRSSVRNPPSRVHLHLIPTSHPNTSSRRHQPGRRAREADHRTLVAGRAARPPRLAGSLGPRRAAALRRPSQSLRPTPLGSGKPSFPSPTPFLELTMAPGCVILVV